jgi:hypothetical protein
MIRRLTVLAPAALTVGTVLLLSACGQTQANSTGGSSENSAVVSSTSSATNTPTQKSNTPTQKSSTPTQKSPQKLADRPEGSGDKASGLKPVVCGPVTVGGGATQTLIADPTPDGIVGCTEAFNVIDEFFRTPVQQRPANGLQNTRLPSGWECGTDDGEHNVTRCFTIPGGKRGVNFVFHTEVVSK